MKSKTYTLPDGETVRPQSQRRYVLVSTWRGTARIVYRTDVLERAIAKGCSTDFIIDQVKYTVHRCTVQTPLVSSLVSGVTR